MSHIKYYECQNGHIIATAYYDVRDRSPAHAAGLAQVVEYLFIASSKSPKETLKQGRRWLGLVC